MQANRLSIRLAQISRWFFVLAAIVSICASAFLPRSISAASPIYVNASAAAGGNGLSWATAFNNLQDAIDIAVSGEEIWVAAGTYHPSTVLRPEDPRSASFFLKNGVAIYGGFAGSETLLTQRNWTANVTILDGQITPAEPELPYQVYHVVRGGGMPSTSTRLDGFTISNGRADGSPATSDFGGGGVFINATNMTLANLIIRNHFAGGSGGGINASYSALTVVGVRLEDNTATNGGGFYNHEDNGSVITDTVFANNHAVEHGGGLYDYVTNTTFTDVTFTDNSALTGGGGIFANNSAITVENATFTGNIAGELDGGGGVITVGSGGAMLVQSNLPVRVEETTFHQNVATGSGGAVVNAYSTSIWYRNTFTNNHAYGYGGAFQNFSSACWIGNSRFHENWANSMGGALDLSYMSTSIVTNSIFTGNHSMQGGAIRIIGPHSAPRLTNLTITHNSVSGGDLKGSGIVQIEGSLEANSTIVNSIVYDNAGATQIHVANAQMDLSNSIVPTYTVEGTGVILGGAAILTSNPLFIDADGADNLPGNMDDDLRIPSNSPAVDVGVAGDLDIHDMDGDSDVSEAYPFHMGAGPRVVDLPNAPISAPSTTPAVDLGAYEAQPPVLSVVKTSGGGPLYEATSFPITITVTNTGLGDAHNVVISDTLPADLVMVPGSLVRSMGVAGTLPVMAQGFDLLPGQFATVSFNATVADGPLAVSNTAQATADEVITPAQGNVLLSVANLPPQNVTVIPPVGTVFEGASAQYNSSFTDPAGEADAPFTGLWTFGDGTAPISGATTQNHTYQDSGTYNIVVRVTDADGGYADSAATPVTITNVAPQVSLNPVGSGSEGIPINFTGSFTDIAQNLDAPYTYTWTLDATTVINSGTVASYNPASPPVLNASAAMGFGPHTITLSVMDKDGGSNSITSSPFTVADVPPEVTISATGSPIEGTPFTFTANVVDAGTSFGETFTYSWNFGSGPVAGSAVQAHTFANSGIYNVTVSVTGSHGGSDTSPVFPVTVLNAVPVASIQPVGATNEGALINFTGSFTDLGGANDTPYQYEWVLDGTTVIGSGQVNTYNPALPPVVSASRAMGSGVHTVTLQVTDDDGGVSALASATFTVNNVAPVASVTSSGTAYEDAAFIFTGSFVDPGQPFGETYAFSWNFGDGSAPVTGTLTPSHVYADSGSYQVVLTVTDSDNDSGVSLPYLLTVSNVAPTPSIQPVTGAVEGSPVNFSGSFTDPAENLDQPYQYVWRLDGLIIGSGTVTSYVPGIPPVVTDSEAMLTGSHTIALQVTDLDGDSGSTSQGFMVANVNPTVDVTATGTAYDGVPFAFHVAFTDPGQTFGETYTIAWDFGDGTVIANGGTTEEHAFATQGSHTITVTVRDGHNGQGADNITINVQNSVPVASIDGVTGSHVEGNSLQFHGSGTDVSPSGSIVGYAWNFGDGEIGTGAVVNHAYRDNGSYTVTLTVTDNNGATDTDSAIVIVSNAAPVVDAGTSPYGKVGLPLQFLGSFSDAGLDDTHTIHWDFGDGTSIDGVLNPTHSYATKGTYTVILTVTDDDGGIGTDTAVGNVELFKFFIPILGVGNP